MSWEGTEKRNFIRANFPCKILIHTPSEHVLIVHTENIGTGGVRTIIEENLDISSVVGLEVFIGGTQIICKGRVVWVVVKAGFQKDDTNIWDTGIEFYEISDRDKKVVKDFVNSIILDQPR
ncbi:MAG: PilZ domain-containing protein [Candidatus Susulua stagnicola]|nr:PilZ domain-containing protein [Candidatus Susulua stagnicola]